MNGTINNKDNLKKICLAGIFIAISVVMSTMAIPVGTAKCLPVQHAVNVFAAVFLGPFYGVGMAFITSLIRVISGTGTLLAFPGSMCGALICGLMYKYTKNVKLTCLGEAVGTGVIGALLAYPIAAFILGKEAAIFTFIIPFSISSIGGSIAAGIIVTILARTRVFFEGRFQ